MKNNLTREKERANYWKTLIDAKEDMNKMVQEFLKATEKEVATNSATVKASEGNKAP